MRVFNHSSQKILLFGWAALLIVLATGLIVITGLPERRSYTGIYLPDTGYIAPETNALAPDFVATTLDGELIMLQDNREQPIILNFWATWCIPCLDELSLLQSLQETYPQVLILAINRDNNSAMVRDWLITHNLTLKTIVDTDNALAQLYRLRGIPSTYLIATDATITDIIYGIADEYTLKTWIEAQT